MLFLLWPPPYLAAAWMAIITASSVWEQCKFIIPLYLDSYIHNLAPGYMTFLIAQRQLNPGLHSFGLTLKAPITHLKG